MQHAFKVACYKHRLALRPLPVIIVAPFACSFKGDCSVCMHFYRGLSKCLWLCLHALVQGTS